LREKDHPFEASTTQAGKRAFISLCEIPRFTRNDSSITPRARLATLVAAIDPFDFAQGRLSIAMVPHLRE